MKLDYSPLAFSFRKYKYNNTILTIDAILVTENSDIDIDIPLINCGDVYEQYKGYIYKCFDFRAVNLTLKTNFVASYGIYLFIEKCDPTTSNV